VDFFAAGFFDVVFLALGFFPTDLAAVLAAFRAACFAVFFVGDLAAARAGLASRFVAGRFAAT
jgi:hypothetical protein